MKKETLKYISVAAVFLLAFVLFTVVVKTVDVRAVGPMFSKVGLSHINERARDLAGRSAVCHDISQMLGYLAIAVCVCFACVGLYQLVSSRSLKGISRGIWAIGGLYVLLVAVYLFFDKVLVINYRPVIGDKAVLEPSYPSSHSLLAVCVFLSASDQIGRLVENRFCATALSCLCWICAGATVVTRFLSGGHWLTDIAGSLLLSGFFICLYLAAAGEKK